MKQTAYFVALLIGALFAICVPQARGCDICQRTCALGQPADQVPPGPGEALFQLQGGTWPGWRSGQPLTLTYSYNNLLDGGLRDPRGEPVPAAQIRTAIEEAFRVWSEVVPVTFVEVPDMGGPVIVGNSGYGNGQFGQIRFSHRYINGPDPPGGSPTTKALAFFPSSGGNIAGDIHFDNGDPWQLVGTLSEPDILGAAIHEIGHTLGLGHTDVPQANMYWIFKRHAGPGTGMLHSDDIAGARAIYGVGSGQVIPLPIAEPSSTTILLFGVTLVAAANRYRVAIR